MQAALARARTPEVLASAALLELAGGDLDAAAAHLEEAVGEAPREPILWSDLAGVYLERARAEDSPYDLLLSLAAADRAVALGPPPALALFNRALALQRLGLDGAAKAAWEDYLQADHGSSWAEEARRHLGELEGPTEEAFWEAARVDLERAAGAGRADEVAELVRRFRSRIQRFGQEEILPGWAELALAGRSAEAQEALEVAHVVGRALSEAGGDATLAGAVDAIHSIAVGAGEGEVAALAAAQLAYRRGTIAYRGYDLATAEDALTEAQGVLLRRASPLGLWAEYYLALCAYQRYRYDEARERLVGLEAPRVLDSYPDLLGRVLLIDGVVDIIGADHEQAFEKYRRALAAVAGTGDPENLAAIHHVLFEFFYFVGDHREAWRHLHRSLTRLDQVVDLRRRQLILEGAAVAALTAGEPGAALYFQDEAVRIARVEDHSPALVSALRWRATMRQQAGSEDGALADLETGLAEAERIADAEARDGALGDLLLAAGEIETGRDPAAAVDRLTEALAVLERTGYRAQQVRGFQARARAYRRLGDPERMREDLAAGIAEVERQRARLLADRRVGFLDDAGGLFEEMVLLEIAQGRPESAFVYAEKGRARQLADLMAVSDGPTASDDLAGLTVDALRRRLPPETVLIAYTSLEDRLLAWAVGREYFKFAEQTLPAAALDRRIERLRAAILRKESNALDDRASELHDLLLGPFEDVLSEAARVVFVPDGSLHLLPFAVLRSRASGRYLVEEHLVETAPGALAYLRSLERFERRLPAGAPAVLLVGDPQFDPDQLPGLRRLRAADGEVTSIEALYTGADLLTGAEATREAVEALIGGKDVLHLATHALPNAQYPALARIVLAADPENGDAGLVYARDLEAWDLSRTRLVVLSACGTAAGPISATEGPFNLARPLLAAGAPAVVATLWNVDDAPAARLGVELHRRLAAGESPTQALRGAQLALLRSDEPALRAPRAWAAFELIGAGAGLIDRTSEINQSAAAVERRQAS